MGIMDAMKAIFKAADLPNNSLNINPVLNYYFEKNDRIFFMKKLLNV